MSSSAGGFGSRAPQNSENLGDYPERIIALLVDATMLPFRQLYFFARRLLVGDFAQNMSERIQPRPPLIVGMHDIPRRPRGVGREEHLVACPRVVEPVGIRFEIHVGQLPDLAPVVDAPLQAPRLLFGADLQPILQQNDPGIDDELLEYGHHLQEAFGLLLGAEPHHALDPGSVVPAAVEDHDLPCRRQMWNVSLGVHLRLFALGRRGKRDHPENARANPLGHGFDRAALAGAVAPLEEDADLEALVHDPLLELDELDMQARKFALVFLQLQLAVGFRVVVLGIGHIDAPFSLSRLRSIALNVSYFQPRVKQMSSGMPRALEHLLLLTEATRSSTVAPTRTARGLERLRQRRRSCSPRAGRRRSSASGFRHFGGGGPCVGCHPRWPLARRPGKHRY